MSTANLVLSGGTCIGPATGELSTRDVFVAGGVVAESAAENTDTHTVDCADALVLPGLIDFHGHFAVSSMPTSVPARESELHRGVVAANDGGSAGARTLDQLQADLAHASPLTTSCFLNISPRGIGDVRGSEYAGADVAIVDEAVLAASTHPGFVKGVKVRLSRAQAGADAARLLDYALEAATQAALPLMVHPGDTHIPIAQILARLRGGDILTHCFHGKSEGLVENGIVIEAARAARERGVLFDVGHGSTQFSYTVARTALDAGFQPDIISTDLTRNNWAGPVMDLPHVMSKFLALGMTLPEVLRATTAAPAAVLRLGTFGAIQPGETARLSVLRWSEYPEPLVDSAGIAICAPLLRARFVVIGNDVIESEVESNGVVAKPSTTEYRSTVITHDEADADSWQ